MGYTGNNLLQLFSSASYATTEPISNQSICVSQRLAAEFKSEELKLESLVLSPNPTKSDITISNLEVHQEVEILNSLGKIVIKLTALSPSEAISVSNLAGGIYIVNSIGRKPVKFIKVDDE